MATLPDGWAAGESSGLGGVSGAKCHKKDMACRAGVLSAQVPSPPPTPLPLLPCSLRPCPMLPAVISSSTPAPVPCISTRRHCLAAQDARDAKRRWWLPRLKHSVWLASHQSTTAGSSSCGAAVSAVQPLDKQLVAWTSLARPTSQALAAGGGGRGGAGGEGNRYAGGDAAGTLPFPPVPRLTDASRWLPAHVPTLAALPREAVGRMCGARIRVEPAWLTRAAPVTCSSGGGLARSVLGQEVLHMQVTIAPRLLQSLMALCCFSVLCCYTLHHRPVLWISMCSLQAALHCVWHVYHCPFPGCTVYPRRDAQGHLTVTALVVLTSYHRHHHNLRNLLVDHLFPTNDVRGHCSWQCTAVVWPTLIGARLLRPGIHHAALSTAGSN